MTTETQEETMGEREHPCPKGDECALNRGAVHCKACGRNWPPDETWAAPQEQADEARRRQEAAEKLLDDLSKLPEQVDEERRLARVRPFDRMEILGRLKGIESGGLTRYEQELSAALSKAEKERDEWKWKAEHFGTMSKLAMDDKIAAEKERGELREFVEHLSYGEGDVARMAREVLNTKAEGEEGTQCV